MTSPHSLELLHPTAPPEARALRLVVLALAVALLLGVLVVQQEPETHLPTAMRKQTSSERNP